MAVVVEVEGGSLHEAKCRPERRVDIGGVDNK